MITTNQNLGRMDRRITLRYPLVAKSATGAVTESWVEVDPVWAQWLPSGSREFIAAQARNAETTGILRIRHRIDVAATWRLLKGDDLFKLTGDPIEVGRREYLDLPVAALNQSPGTALSLLQLEGTAGTALLLLEDDTPLELEPAA
jgi:SPP1 family predicted phage head-tail adaptor